MPNSSISRKTVAEIGFRKRFGVNVIAIRRKQIYITADLASVPLQAGDVLLVQGSWEAIGGLDSDPSAWVVIGQPLAEAAKVTLDYKASPAAAIMVAMIVALIFEFVPPVIAVLCAAMLTILSGCFRNVEDAYKKINWESVVLIAAMMPMSFALEKTGISSLVSSARRLARVVGPAASARRHIFHHIGHDSLYKQYGHRRPAGTHSHAECSGARCECASVSICRDLWRESMFCFSVFHAAQCPRDASRPIYIFRLYQGGPASAAHHGSDNDPASAGAISFLMP